MIRLMTASRLDTIRRVAVGELTVDDAAAQHGVSPETIHDWSELLLAGAQHERRKRGGLRMVLVGAFAAAGLLGGVAWAQACTPQSYGSLIGVCPNQPALASTYNNNLSSTNARLNSAQSTADGASSAVNTLRGQTEFKLGPFANGGVSLQEPTRLSGRTCGAAQVVSIAGDGSLECTSLFNGTNVARVTRSVTHRRTIDNTVGAQEQHNLLGANEGFCFLTEVSLRDIDDGNEMGTCRVYIDGNNTWTLMAQISGSTGDADAYCEAMCIKFQ